MNSSNKNTSSKPSVAVIGLKGLPAFGGAATVGESLIRELYSRYRFTVFSVKSHTDGNYALGDVKQIILQGCRWKKMNVLLYYIQAALTVLFSRKGKYQLVHLNHTDAAFIAPLLRIRYPLVITSHARPQDGGKWSSLVKLFFQINERIAVYSANVFTTVSKSLSVFYTKKYNVAVRYIPNGVNADLKDEVAPLTGTQPFLFFSAGRIIPIKGLHLLIDALKKIAYKGSIKVAGNMDQVVGYRQEIHSLAEGLDVEYLGLIKEKTTLLAYAQAADLFVLPSLTEAMSIMLLEVGLMKTPMIVSDIEANKNVFEDGEVLFFKSGDVPDLAEKLTYAFDNKEQMHDKAEKAYNKLVATYQWKDIAEQYATIYDRLIDQN
ncbi:MAG: glycosyltransferase family 4 protein [Carboxylicivirga sp.]|nr:glycosyltransferase family 4 protein [Carboxylicivirga sp.]